MPMQYSAIINGFKIVIFRWKLVMFLIFGQNIERGYVDRRYTLELPQWGGSNEYPQYMFYNSNKKRNVYLCKPHAVLLYKTGV